MRLGLERIQRALECLGHPERGLRVLHVAGTNGKGSTCAMAVRALALAGHKTGLYTSPHLVRFNERIALDGRSVTDAELDRLAEKIERACPWHVANEGGDRLTYFEFATLLALLHFAEGGAEAVVLEVGLGGRFDATNVVLPLVCAVTRIGLDHTDLLGSTLAEIAREKAGIMKPRVPVIVAYAQPEEAMAVLRAEAERKGAPFTVAPAAHPGAIGLSGPHQRGNAAVAAAALRALDTAGLRVPEHAIERGIAEAAWPGRLELVGGVLLDGAHNPDGAAALAAALAVLHPGAKVELVFGVLAEKDYRSMLKALRPAVHGFHLVLPSSPRGRPPSSYLELARVTNPGAHVHASLEEALSCARRAARMGSIVCVAGSLYLVGEARQLLGGGGGGEVDIPPG